MIFRFTTFELATAVRELRGDGELVHTEQQVFDVLLYLLTHDDRVVPKTELLDEVWGDRFVSESTLTSRIRDARRAIGDSGQEQRLIKTVHGVGYRFIGDVTVTGVEAADSADGSTTNGDSRSASADVDLVIRFVDTDDSTLAVGETGSGPYLVKAATWLTQLDTDTNESPIWSHWVRSLSRSFRYVRYDPRGCGLSDRDLAGRALDDLDLWVEDLARVIDSTKQEQVALLGISQGGPVAIAYAARYPDRVSHLVLYGTYLRGMRRRGDVEQETAAELQVDLARIGWGPDRDEFREVFARQFVPDAQAEEIAWFNDQLRSTTNAVNAPQLEGAFHDLDLTDTARTLTVPTLVFHADDDRATPFAEGRFAAGVIPGARFVPLHSKNHVLLQRDAAFNRFMRDIESFVLPDG